MPRPVNDVISELLEETGTKRRSRQPLSWKDYARPYLIAMSRMKPGNPKRKEYADKLDKHLEKSKSKALKKEIKDAAKQEDDDAKKPK